MTIDFTTTQMLSIFASLALSIPIVIYSYKLWRIQTEWTPEFSVTNFFYGIITAISMAFVLLNWSPEGGAEKVYAIIEDIEPDIMHIPRTILLPDRPVPKVNQIKIAKPILNIKEIIASDEVIEPKPDIAQPNSDVADDPLVMPLPIPEPAQVVAPVIPEIDDQPFLITEQMPRFPGCEEDEALTKKEREQCAIDLLQQYMSNTVRYPAIARDNGIEGLAVIQFIVDTDGSIIKAEIVRDPGGGCGAEALRVVKSMNSFEEKWTAGKHRGRPVKVRFTLPVKFKLG